MRNLNTILANGRLELRIKFELEFRPKFYLKIAPLKHEFTSLDQILPRITRTALTQIAVLKPTEVSWQEKSNLIKFTPNNRLAKIRFNFIIIRLKFKLLKLILMYNLSLRKIIKIPNLRSKNGRGSSKS